MMLRKNLAEQCFTNKQLINEAQESGTVAHILFFKQNIN